MLKEIPEGEDWREHGACWDSAPFKKDGPFFPAQDYGGKEARAICAGCAVTEYCLEFALVTRQPTGVWGGTTFSQRVRIRHNNPERY